MAKRANKTTLGERYRAIMEKDGFGPREWVVLSFSFKSESLPERFHYRLMMAEPRPRYFLFDCYEKTANVIVPNDEQNSDVIKGLAQQLDGESVTPNLR